jgi:hypothetical protein
MAKRFTAVNTDTIGTIANSFTRKTVRGEVELNEEVHFAHNGMGTVAGRKYLAHIEFTAKVTIIREIEEVTL